MKVLITGGAGYIGSHTALELINKKYDISVIDNFSNGSIESLKRVQEYTGKVFDILNIDITDLKSLKKDFISINPDCVIHFAGLKSVSESVEDPIKYYKNNVSGSLNLLEVMDHCECNNIIYSSSATVYGDPKYLPYDEAHDTNPVNPYGVSKLMVEDILKTWSSSNILRSSISLRYFNPVGAHFSGIIGEDPKGIPNNLMPYISQVASGQRDKLYIYGNDYNTRDGTGERDYIHVTDLAFAHISALKRIDEFQGHNVFNIGSGRGVTVLEILNSFEKISGKKISYEFKDRRPGDLASFWACPNKAKEFLGWETLISLDEVCRDSWNWQKNNPNGYPK